MIILITGNFPIFINGIDTGRTEFVVSHGIDMDTDKPIITTNEHPSRLGGTFDAELGEWVIR